MANTLAKRSSSLAVPSRQELEALGPGDRWTLEERLGDAQTLLREFNNDELRRWVEVEGKTQTEIAKLVGRSQARISQRCSALGIISKNARTGRPSGLISTDKSDEEVIDAEVVEDDPLPAPPTEPGPAHQSPAAGVRSAQHQQRLIASVAGRMEDIETSIGEIDLAKAVEAMTEGERHQCLLQLRSGRTAVSQLIKALE